MCRWDCTLKLPVIAGAYKLYLFQDKVYEEIEELAATSGDDFTADNLGKLKYVEQVFKETSRLYPVLGYVSRRCTKDWQIPGSKFVIQKGTTVQCSVTGTIHLVIGCNVFPCKLSFHRYPHGP